MSWVRILTVAALTVTIGGGNPVAVGIVSCIFVFLWIASAYDTQGDGDAKPDDEPAPAESDEETKTRKRILDVDVAHALKACDRMAREAVAPGCAGATELHHGRRALAEQALLQLARCNPTREELFRALAGIDPIALRDVVEQRFGTGEAERNAAIRNNECVRIDAIDFALMRRGTNEDWSRPLVLFVRSQSELVSTPASS